MIVNSSCISLSNNSGIMPVKPALYGFGETQDPDFVIDVTHDGDHYTIEMPVDYSKAAVYFGFYSDPEGYTPAIPSAGTIDVSGNQVNDLYIKPSTGDATIDATQVTLTPTYNVPWFNGYVKRIKINVQGIQGATHMRAVVWRA